jgi:hypothetical protein
MKLSFAFKKSKKERQLTFRFIARRIERERRFKATIVLSTLFLIVIAVAAVPAGRHAARVAWTRAFWEARRWAFGLAPDRSEIDRLWKIKRERGVDLARGEFRRRYAESSPSLQNLLKTSAMDPDSAIVRWGNFDQTFVLSSLVFENDDTGRSYRLRPSTRSIWLRQIVPPEKIPGLFLFQVPDTPDVRAAIPHTQAIVVDESVENTNSWGCRGGEPDLKASFRVLVLGDSFMQGLLVGDADAPPNVLIHSLEDRMKRSVSVLNTGCLGYSFEQYYYTLKYYFDRFDPDFVVVGFFANDCGGVYDLIERGLGDFAETSYWISEIEQYCRTRRDTPCLFVASPAEEQLGARRRQGNYPGRIADLLGQSGMYFLDPTDAFINENLRVTAELASRDERPTTSPLFNGKYGDGHFSPLGSRVWARVVAERIDRLWNARSHTRRQR